MVRHGSAKAAFVGSIPTLASKLFCARSKGFGRIDEAIVSRNVSKIAAPSEHQFDTGLIL